jgi:TIGR00341 family protein
MLKSLLRYLNLHTDLENFDEIHENIEKGIIFRGTNLWILVAAIVIASVGLNTNSTAVIIGAMLISPLMGPINGMGYSIAVNDGTLFKRSIKNFTFAVLASIIASTLYFAISPVSNAQSELLARTSPTIYDVLIALFGGFAGIIAISSRHKGNVIPGVAIATALMPPLCTAGYGLATGQFNFFFGAFYLFTINTVCIAMSSAIVSQALKFPIRSNIADSQKKRINQAIWLVLAITILPSIYLGYQLVQNEKFTVNAEKYIESVNIYKGNYLLKSNILAEKKQVELIYGGTSLTDDDKLSIRQRAEGFNIDYQDVDVKQGLSVEVKQQIDKNIIQENTLRQEIARLTALAHSYELKFDSIETQKQKGSRLLTEITSLYPQINSCSYSQAYTYTEDSVQPPAKTNIVIFSLLKPLKKDEKEKIQEWLNKRLQSEQVITLFNE